MSWRDGWGGTSTRKPYDASAGSSNEIHGKSRRAIAMPLPQVLRSNRSRAGKQSTRKARSLESICVNRSAFSARSLCQRAGYRVMHRPNHEVVPHDLAVLTKYEDRRKAIDAEPLDRCSRSIALEPVRAGTFDERLDVLQCTGIVWSQADEDDRIGGVIIVGLDQALGRFAAWSSPMGPGIEHDDLPLQVRGRRGIAVEPPFGLERGQGHAGDEQP